MTDHITVPVEPTKEMLEAGCKRHLPQQASPERMRLLYKAMLAAAPRPDDEVKPRGLAADFRKRWMRAEQRIRELEAVLKGDA